MEAVEERCSAGEDSKGASSGREDSSCTNNEWAMARWDDGMEEQLRGRPRLSIY